MRHIGQWLILAGLGVWIFGFLTWTFGVWVTMPPDTVRVLVLSLAALSGAGLMLFGAALSRARRKRMRDAERL